MGKPFRPSAVLARLVPLCWVMSACTMPAPWGDEGTRGQSCFPDGSCDKGLACVSEGDERVCRPRAGRPDGGIDGLSLADAACWLDQKLELTRVPRLVTGSNLVVIEGKAAPGITEVQLLGPDVEESTAVSSGSFCLAVKLETKQATFSLFGRDAQGCVTEAIRVEAHETLGINTLTDRLPAGPWRRDVPSLTDGSPSTTVQLSVLDPNDPSDKEYCNEYAYVWFSLPEEVPIGRVALRYPEAVAPRYVVCWSLAGSTARDPSPPWPSVVNPWDFLLQSTHGSEGDLLIDLAEPQRLRHLAVLMYEDALPGAETEIFEIAEIEAWTPPSTEQASCD